MERERLSEPYGSERGVGGKFRKQPYRKPPATPYQRPAKEADQKRGGWFSKIVNPASRLISSSASRLLPSLFSKAAPVALPVSDNEDPEVKPDVTDEDPNLTSEIRMSRSTEGGGSSAEQCGLKRISDTEPVGEKLGNSSDCIGLADIEKLMKEKTFSRDELKRLTELLQSRVVSDADGRGKENKSMAAIAESVEGVITRENLRTSFEKQQADYSSKFVEEISDPHPLSTVAIRDEVGASPIEIAKAYMGARRSDNFESNPYIPSPSHKSAICWPGTLVNEQHNYLTPQTQQRRTGPHYFPRTPYSRTPYSRSASKLTPLKSVGDKSVNIFFSHREQSQNPIYGDKQLRSGIEDNGFGSSGPIRRTRQKFVSMTPSKGFTSSHSVRSRFFSKENSNASTGFLPTGEKNPELEAYTSTSKFQRIDSKEPSPRKEPGPSVGFSTVHPHSSEMARKILEHLEGTTPSPKDKSTYPNVATPWKKPPSFEFSTGKPMEQPEGSESHKNSSLFGGKFFTQGNGDAQNSSADFQPGPRKTREDNDAENTNISAVNSFSGGVSSGRDVSAANTWAMPSKSTFGTQEGNGNVIEKNQPLPKLLHGSEILNAQKRPPTFSFGSKPALTSIFIDKPGSKHVLSPAGSGFTFPVSSSSALLSEPPTPSFISSSPPRPKDDPTVPSFSFGSNGSGRVLVFSFPSTSNCPNNDAPTPTFKFGSNKKKISISFESFSKDAICC